MLMLEIRVEKVEVLVCSLTAVFEAFTKWVLLLTLCRNYICKSWPFE